MDLSDLVQDREWYIACQSGNGFPAVKKYWKFLDYLQKCKGFKKNSPHGVK
jgi:hypothetical protein